ncbi:MAG: hypothetical protein EOS25_07355 [Mesorhizobium sp.]|nr:MAG: hypothetical protein EOS34_27160 [Mesorhizobium sp.]RWD50437.1 MAG: hypothetical protein EOS59_09760 [Mesorhizobium sp.]RWE63130.1 MAG: hypothetical protein EOS24_04255 [Mesorhizobium sp.]RWF10605.1 MAG: hypothetical protein EOS69_13675 [Mesorhizobium sp.]RWF20685.1 MAG: hypothetical protein EOS25_07355 [Mesorhizobium sp.]
MGKICAFTGTAQEPLNVSKQGTPILIDELGLGEMTGRGRFGLWGLV